MWLRRSTSIFIKVAVMAILVSGWDPVTLDENNTVPVTVPTGSPLILKCNLTRPPHRSWINWYFNSGRPFPDKKLKKIKIDSEEVDQTTFQVTPNARQKNTGWYCCILTIEIPKLINVTSSARKVVIMPISPTVSCKGMACKHWAILGVLAAAILIVLPVALFFLRNRFHQSSVDDPIYANTRPVANKQPSPRLKMQLQSLKTAPSSYSLQDSTAGGRYEDGKQRNKH